MSLDQYEAIIRKIKIGGKYDGDFRRDIEEYHSFTNLPKEVKDKIHLIAWDRGHAHGYHEVFCQYDDLIELIRVVEGYLSEA